jgi:hypothetical protein
MAGQSGFELLALLLLALARRGRIGGLASPSPTTAACAPDVIHVRLGLRFRRLLRPTTSLPHLVRRYTSDVVKRGSSRPRARRILGPPSPPRPCPRSHLSQPHVYHYGAICFVPPISPLALYSILFRNKSTNLTHAAAAIPS